MSDKVKRVWVWVVLLGTSFVSGMCTQNDDPKPGPPVQPKAIGTADVWLTTGDQTSLLAQQKTNLFEAKETASIILDSTIKYQEIEGFGAALTGSSAYLINRKMSTASRNTLLNDLFHPENGIGISYLRMTIGASDFSLSDYTYNDMPAGQTDYPLTNFSIAKDKEDVVPVFKQILNLNPSVRIMGSPWSAPAWMKTNGSLKGGKLRTDAYSTYAQYFVKYIQEYKSNGIEIDAVTPQNEPLHFTASYPCMEMQPNEQLSFVRDNLGPAFAAAGIDTRIIVYDHNWDNTSYPITILNDPTASGYIAGSAFHAYAGSVSAMSVVHNAHPGKGIYFTEVSGGNWATNFTDNLMWNMTNIFVGSTKNWSKVVLLWNLALDENFGPKNNGCQDCRGVVTINSTTGSVTKNVEYYSIAHFSKFVEPGAVRISSVFTESIADVDHVAFLNADGSKVLVLLNAGTSSRTVTVKLGGRQFTYTINSKAVATIVWT
ncbi:MAG TPA: glycoside hydrolase family 30 beta sandwich domain-containing protein [Chryseosolibacter sp.]